MLFDVLFMLQHFVLYRAPRHVSPAAPLHAPLMGAGETDSAAAAWAAAPSPAKERARLPGLMEPE